MRELGKTRIFGINVYVDRLSANMVMPKYIDEILNEVRYGNDEKGSYRMEEVIARSKCFDA